MCSQRSNRDRSGDYGCGFFGITLEASATIINHPDFGWLCYLCNIVSSSTTGVTFTVVDAYKVRAYLEPLGVYLTALAGNLQTISLELSSSSSSCNNKQATIAFAPATSARPFTVLQLAVEKQAAPGLRPGSSFSVVDADGKPCVQRRGAYEIQPNADDTKETVVTLLWKD